MMHAKKMLLAWEMETEFDSCEQKHCLTFVQIEPPNALRSLQRLKAVERHLGRTRDKLQKQRLLLLAKAPQHRPEPRDLRVTALVAVVVGMDAQVVEVDVR